MSVRQCVIEIDMKELSDLINNNWKEQHTEKLKRCHHLFTFMSFQTCITCFFCNDNNILKNNIGPYWISPYEQKTLRRFLPQKKAAHAGLGYNDSN